MDPFEGTGQGDPQDPLLSNPIDPNKNYFEELVGEGKKFRDEAALARSKVESDRFIAQLQNELSGIRNELKTRTTLEQFMDQMKQAGQKPQDSEPPAPKQDDQRTTYTQEELKELLKQTLSEEQQAALRQKNYNTVVEKLQETYGDDMPRVVQQAANDLGMSLQSLKDMASANPTAFLRLVGAEAPKRNEADLFAPPPRSQTREPQVGSGETGRTLSYYEKIRQTDPNKYWSAQVQNQLHKDAQRLQERFFDIQ